MPASGVNSLRKFHTGKVVALACLRPLSTEIMEASGGVLVTGGEPRFFFFVDKYCVSHVQSETELGFQQPYCGELTTVLIRQDDYLLTVGLLNTQ